MKRDNPKVIQDFYEFLLWMTNHVSRFPRHHRHSLGASIESRLQHLMACLIRARYRKNRKPILDHANIELEVLRFQIRVTKDLQILSLKSHEYASKSLIAIGKQIGGWSKSTERAS